MRLVDIRNLIKSITDYDPNTTDYDDELTRIINNVYTELFSEKPWSFAQKERTKLARADDTATDGVTVINTRQIVTVAPFFSDPMEGQVIEIQGKEYEIAAVESNTVAHLKTTCDVGGSGQTFKVKYRYLDLPVNTISVLQIGRRDTTDTPPSQPGRYTPLTRMEDEWYNISLDETGTPTDWIPYDTVSVQTPVHDIYPGATGAPTSTEYWGAGTYTFVYTLRYGNRFSAPSKAHVLTLPTAGKNLKIKFPKMLTVVGDDRSGFKRQAWVKFDPYKAYRKIGDEVDSDTESVEVAGPGAQTGNWELGDRLNYHGGTYQRVRLYPRPSADTTVTIRFIFAPELLIEDTDAPQMPGGCHQYLAYKALVDVFSKHDNTAQAEVYRRKSELEILKMEQRYLTEISRRWVKSGYGVEPTFRPNRFGPLTTSG